MNGFDELISAANAILWHDYVLYALLITGLTFTIWSRFCQYRALTHGLRVTRGESITPAIRERSTTFRHFQPHFRPL